MLEAKVPGLLPASDLGPLPRVGASEPGPRINGQGTCLSWKPEPEPLNFGLARRPSLETAALIGTSRRLRLETHTTLSTVLTRSNCLRTIERISMEFSFGN
jgi:hypothetical protein